MARIRTIKPEFFTSLTIADLPLTARLTFIGLWTHVDDDGRCVDEPRLVRAAVWPLDDRTAAEVEDDLRTLRDASLIVRYEAAGRRYLAVTSWREHQRIDKPKPSKLPAPDDGTPTPPEPLKDATDTELNSANNKFRDTSGTCPGIVQEPSGTHPGHFPVGKEQGTGKGREQEPPLPPAPRQAHADPSEGPSEKTRSERMTEEWWQQYGRRIAQTKRTIRQAVADALVNGIDPDELWAALVRLGETSKPVTGGTLQFALADIRRPQQGAFLVPLPGGGQTPTRRSTTDERVAQGLAIAAELRALENGDTA